MMKGFRCRYPCMSSAWLVILGAVGLFFRVKVTLAIEEGELEWHPATATWYGSPDGDGSDGGACGYSNLVDMKPYRKHVSAVSPVLFRGGEGCGACYKVKCVDKSLCAKRAVTIVVTDECGGGTHFDLSGSAFRRMAVADKTTAILNSGEIPVLFRRTLCKFPWKNVTFHVNEGSSAYWFSILIEYEDGDGDVGAVHMQEADSSEWMAMEHSWGANWFLLGGPMKAPFSLRVTTFSSNRTLSATNIIPQNWYPTASYSSRINFD